VVVEVPELVDVVVGPAGVDIDVVGLVVVALSSPPPHPAIARVAVSVTSHGIRLRNMLSISSF